MSQDQKFKINDGIIYTYYKSKVIFWAVESVIHNNKIGKIPAHVNDVDIYG